MERIEEIQQPPLAFTLGLTVIVIAFSEFFTRFTAATTAQSNQVFWLIDRAAGITAYELLSLSVILGLSMTLKFWDNRGLRKWAKQLHQYMTLLVLPFIGLHLFGLLQDSSVPFSIGQLLLPLTASYKPFLSALGSLSLYGAIILIATSYLRHKMSAKVWRVTHILAFPTFLAVTIHGFTIGTDSHSLIGYLLYAVPLSIVIIMSTARLGGNKEATRQHRRPLDDIPTP